MTFFFFLNKTVICASSPHTRPVTGGLGITPPQEAQTLHPDGLKNAQNTKRKVFNMLLFFLPRCKLDGCLQIWRRDADRCREKLLKRSWQTTAYADPHARQRSSRTRPKHLHLTTCKNEKQRIKAEQATMKLTVDWQSSGLCLCEAKCDRPVARRSLLSPRCTASRTHDVPVPSAVSFFFFWDVATSLKCSQCLAVTYFSRVSVWAVFHR